MKNIYFLFLLLFSSVCFGQYYEQHYIAPAPWQYWNNANEIVIGTIEPNVNVVVQVSKSDGTLVTTLNVTENNPVSYIFTGAFTTTPKNNLNIIENDKGLIIEATHPVMVNVRNIASDAVGSTVANIKGNASLVSFGSEGLGLEFRVGYYRNSVQGLNMGAPVYSVMATEDNTLVYLPASTISLNKGQSYLFNAPMGSLITADKPIVMNTGNYGDTPQICGAAGQDGEDGTFDQIAPVQSLGTKYMVVRGEGSVPTIAQSQQGFGSEQTTIVASKNNTIITIQNFNANGTVAGAPLSMFLNAGDSYTFYHGNGLDLLSSSMITSDQPIIVYSGTAVDCETDISTVLPIGGCSGSLNIQTKKFIDYNNGNLPYYGFCIIESNTVPVFVNGQNIEVLTGNLRVPIGTTGFYLITFDNIQINNPANLIITSTLPLTSSLVQQGGGFSMSAFFSSFGEAADPPVFARRNSDCSVTLEAEDGYSQYVWYKDEINYQTTTNNTLRVTESGSYSVQVMRDCGLSNVSVPLDVEIEPCSDLEVVKERTYQKDLDVTFTITVTNRNPHFTEPNAIATDILPQGLVYVNSTTTKGVYNNTTGIWNIGSLAPNESQTLVIDCTIGSSGDYVNTATVAGDFEDTNTKNNKDTATVEALVADLDAVKDDFRELYIPNDYLEYSIKVTNKGPQRALNVLVKDEMPHATTEMSWSGNGKSGTGDLIDTINALNPNEVVEYKVRLRVPADHKGVFTNSVDVSSEYVVDPNPVCTRCSDTDLPEFNIPRGISPNGDGDNDYLDLSYFFVSRIVIFNRYGQEVYSKNNYTNEWYGQDNNNRILPSGTYFYTAYILNNPYKTGYIEVIREVK